jgi:hypothetical protein
MKYMISLSVISDDFGMTTSFMMLKAFGSGYYGDIFACLLKD